MKMWIATAVITVGTMLAATTAGFLLGGLNAAQLSAYMAEEESADLTGDQVEEVIEAVMDYYQAEGLLDESQRGIVKQLTLIEVMKGDE
jgi:hypothetical protein